MTVRAEIGDKFSGQRSLSQPRSVHTGRLLLTVITVRAKFGDKFSGLRILSPSRLVNTSRLRLTVYSVDIAIVMPDLFGHFFFMSIHKFN